MKKIVFCNVSMSANQQKSVYTSEDATIPVADTAVYYPIYAMLEKTLQKNDEVEVVLLVKQDSFSQYESKLELCIHELLEMKEKTGAKIEYSVIYTKFAETQEVHKQLFLDIIDVIEKEGEGANIIADITYGPKDLPIVLFSALGYLERFFRCEIDNIIYGQAEFCNGKVVNTKICDMVPLFYLNSLTSTMQCDTAEEARKLLGILLTS